ncbi:MAG: trehalose-phosphatase [Sphingobacteriales bacterium UTBCD1]|jgi:trehalose 6-phosphate synthase/phosphatase|nr:MAG: trehalose-phosphatase [Sphingobacteriales bacterium UTBCD1]
MIGTEEYHKISELVKRSGKRLLFLDYDGTLMPLMKFPSLSAPNEDVIRILTSLASDKKNNVVIISGRDSATLGKWLGNLDLIIVAEHGALIKYPGKQWQELAEETDEWKKEIITAMENSSRKCGGSFIEEKRFSLAWHYRNASYESGNFHSRELIRTLSKMIHNTPLQILDGNKIIEVRFTKVNKGAIAKMIMNKVNPDFIMALGDDRTDEDMFSALGRDSINIKIGPGETAAGYSLITQEEVVRFLKELLLKELN